jgi:predicted ATP-grasp superfamily ATP-dependent carboligase
MLCYIVLVGADVDCLDKVDVGFEVGAIALYKTSDARTRSRTKQRDRQDKTRRDKTRGI